jgi:hypothetical protein
MEAFSAATSALTDSVPVARVAFQATSRPATSIAATASIATSMRAFRLRAALLRISRSRSDTPADFMGATVGPFAVLGGVVLMRRTVLVRLWERGAPGVRLDVDSLLCGISLGGYEVIMANYIITRRSTVRRGARAHDPVHSDARAYQW